MLCPDLRAAGGGRIAAPRRGGSGMSQLSFLTVEIAGQLVAILVDAVQAVLPMEEIVPVPLAPSRVVGIATKRGHVLTVIDARAAITGDRSSEPTRESVVININGHRYALLVDAIDEEVGRAHV